MKKTEEGWIKTDSLWRNAYYLPTMGDLRHLGLVGERYDDTGYLRIESNEIIVCDHWEGVELSAFTEGLFQSEWLDKLVELNPQLWGFTWKYLRHVPESDIPWIFPHGNWGC